MSAMIDKLKDIVNPTRHEDVEKGVFKALGNGVWLAAYSNNIKDREGEIISKEAHDRYIARVNAGFVPMPELWHWHIPGTRHGEAKWLGRVDHAVYAVGVFDDTPAGKAAEEHYLASKPGDYQLSHGFTYPVWAKQDGVYQDINTFEITTLRRGKATPAALFTAYEAIKENNMALTQDKIEGLHVLFGESAPAIIDRINNHAADVTKSVEQNQLKYKDYADVTPEQPEPEQVDAKAVETLAETYEETAGVLVEAFEAQSKTVKDVLAAYKVEREQEHKEHQAALGKLNTQIEAFEKALSELRAEIQLRPQRVEEAEKSVDADSTEGKAAAEAIKKQQSGERDPELGLFEI